MQILRIVWFDVDARAKRRIPRESWIPQDAWWECWETSQSTWIDAYELEG